MGQTPEKSQPQQKSVSPGTVNPEALSGLPRPMEGEEKRRGIRKRSDEKEAQIARMLEIARKEGIVGAQGAG